MKIVCNTMGWDASCRAERFLWMWAKAWISLIVAFTVRRPMSLSNSCCRALRRNSPGAGSPRSTSMCLSVRAKRLFVSTARNTTFTPIYTLTGGKGDSWGALCVELMPELYDRALDFVLGRMGKVEPLDAGIPPKPR